MKVSNSVPYRVPERSADSALRAIRLASEEGIIGQRVEFFLSPARARLRTA